MDTDVSAEMTVLDLISTFKETQEVIRAFDAQAGECILCNSLFDSLRGMTEKYGLDLNIVMQEVRRVAHKQG